MIKDCGLYTFAQYLGRDNAGSSRLRAKWLCNYWPEAEIFVMGQEYKTVVFQKAYWPEYATIFKGTKILDICDVKDKDWKKIKQMIPYCDGITTSTETIAKFIKHKTNKPVLCIPDRLDFNFFKEEKKKHHGKAEIVAWQGYDSNFAMLAWAIPSLIKNKIKKLIIISNNQYNLPLPKEAEDLEIINLLWEEETINKNLLLADIVINPHYNKGKWKYKSNNKTISAWALGLPVAHTEAELIFLIDEEHRKLEADKKYEEVKINYDVKKSVLQLQNFIDSVQNKKIINNFQNDTLPNWSKDTKYLKKIIIKKQINDYLKQQKKQIKKRLKTSAPNLYFFIKKLDKKKFFILYLDSLIGKIGLFIKSKNKKLYFFIKKYLILTSAKINKQKIKNYSYIDEKYFYFQKNLSAINLSFFSKYSGVSSEELKKLSFINKNQRQKLLEKIDINKDIFRTLFDYHRLDDAYFIATTISNFEKLNGLNILDFGCLVSDFGLFLGQFQSNIFLCDKKDAFLKLAESRLGSEKVTIKGKYHVNDYSLEKIFVNKDLVIFSEVLEHLDSPINLLKICLASEPRYLYTSHYPYGDKDYFKLSDHKKTAQEQSGACLDLLFSNYKPYLRKRRAILWVKKQIN